MSRSDYRKLLKATFTDDSAEVGRISRGLGDVTWKDSGLLVAALFSLSIEGRFTGYAGEDPVGEFLAEARTEFAAASLSIDPAVAENVVRAAVGDEDLLDTVPPLEGMQVQIALIHKIFIDAGLDSDQIDAMLDKAEALLDQAV